MAADAVIWQWFRVIKEAFIVVRHGSANQMWDSDQEFHKHAHFIVWDCGGYSWTFSLFSFLVFSQVSKCVMFILCVIYLTASPPHLPPLCHHTSCPDFPDFPHSEIGNLRCQQQKEPIVIASTKLNHSGRLSAGEHNGHECSDQCYQVAVYVSKSRAIKSDQGSHYDGWWSATYILLPEV